MTTDNKQSVLTDMKLTAQYLWDDAIACDYQGFEAKVLEALSKLREAGEAVRDWTEDFAHENGNYQCACVQCGEHFFGQKRRVVCKACSAAPQASADPSHPAPASSEDQAIYDSMANSHYDRQQRGGDADLQSAIKDCWSKIIKSLSAIATAGGPDDVGDTELLYRSPVMDEVVRIRQACDELSRAALAAQKLAEGDAIHRLIAEKFSSGNSISVERITITRAEYDAIAQQVKP